MNDTGGWPLRWEQEHYEIRSCHLPKTPAPEEKVKAKKKLTKNEILRCKVCNKPLGFAEAMARKYNEKEKPLCFQHMGT